MLCYTSKKVYELIYDSGSFLSGLNRQLLNYYIWTSLRAKSWNGVRKQTIILDEFILAIQGVLPMWRLLFSRTEHLILCYSEIICSTTSSGAQFCVPSRRAPQLPRRKDRLAADITSLINTCHIWRHRRTAADCCCSRRGWKNERHQ